MHVRKLRSPAALVVEEEHEVELLLRLVLHLLADSQHVHGGHGDGHAVVLAAHPRHVGVDDLQRAGVGPMLRVRTLKKKDTAKAIQHAGHMHTSSLCLICPFVKLLSFFAAF